MFLDVPYSLYHPLSIPNAPQMPLSVSDCCASIPANSAQFCRSFLRPGPNGFTQFASLPYVVCTFCSNQLIDQPKSLLQNPQFLSSLVRFWLLFHVASNSVSSKQSAGFFAFSANCQIRNLCRPMTYFRWSLTGPTFNVPTITL